MRALLDLMRENEAAVQHNIVQSKNVQEEASKHLQILDPLLGEEELVKSVAAELTKVTARMAENCRRQ